MTLPGAAASQARGERADGTGHATGGAAQRSVRSPAAALAPWVALGSLGAVGLAVVGSGIGSLPRPAATEDWWFSLPRHASGGASAAFYAAVGLLVAGWVGVGVQARRGRLPVKATWIVLAAWGLPLLLGPPLFSRDVYSYIGQGVLAHHGLNPYTVAPSALGPGPIVDSIAQVWRNTASPYGPLFVMITHAAAAVSGSSLLAQVLVFRAFELAGLALVMVFLPRLARLLGTDPGLALWMGALSPLALFSFVASAHNDALMVGLLVAGVCVALEGRLLLGVVLCALAATIKLPAAVAVLFLVVEQWRSTPPEGRRRLVAEAVVVPVVVVVAVTELAGLGWTWLGPTALHIPTELRILGSPSVSIGVFVATVLHGLGLDVSRHAVVTAVQDLCSLAAVAGTVWLAFRARGADVVRLLGLALLLIVVGSPTVWPWYLMWGIVLLAATTAQRSRVLAVVAAGAMLVVGPSGTPLLAGDAYVVVTLLAAAGIGWLFWRRHWAEVVDGSPRYAV